MLNVMRTVSALSLLGLVALASVTVFVPVGICSERPCESAASTAGDLFLTYNAYRELIANENDMINHVMMWFLTIQGLLFASFSLVRRGNGLGHGNVDERIRAIGVRKVCIFYSMGVFSAVSVGITFFLAFNTIKCIVTSTPESGTRYVIGLSHGLIPAFVHYLLPWNSLPVLFVAAWHLLVETDAGGPSSLELDRPDTSPNEGSDDVDPEHGSEEPEDARGTAMTTTGPDDERRVGEAAGGVRGVPETVDKG